MKNQEPRTFGQKTLTQCKFCPIMFEVYPAGGRRAFSVAMLGPPTRHVRCNTINPLGTEMTPHIPSRMADR